MATTDTKVGPAIASSSVTNVGSAIVTSGPAANVGTPVSISGFAANVNPTVIVSDSAANVGPVTTSGTTVAASSVVTTVGLSGNILARLLMPALRLSLLLVLRPQFLLLTSLLLL